MQNLVADVTNELQIIYQKLNEHYYESKLPDVIISIQASPRNKYYGWFSQNRWVVPSVVLHEINISAEHLDRTIPEIIGTLNHEMVHLYCEINGIKDTSNKSIYHNKRFKQEAEKRGLFIEYVKTIGWSKTSVTQELSDFISTIDIKASAFNLCRNKVPTKSAASKITIPKTTKYICPECERVVRGEFGMKVICGDCNVEMMANKR